MFFGWSGLLGDWWRLTDKRLNRQTESEWERWMWQTGGQVRLGEGERRLYSPGETGLILTYALEWSEDWHDLLIWAVTAHDGHRRSPVTLFQARRTSCHQDRSKIEINFLLGVDPDRATGRDFHLSLYLSLHLPGSCSLYCYKITQYWTGFYAYFCFSIVFFFVSS